MHRNRVARFVRSTRNRRTNEQYLLHHRCDRRRTGRPRLLGAPLTAAIGIAPEARDEDRQRAGIRQAGPHATGSALTAAETAGGRSSRPPVPALVLPELRLRTLQPVRQPHARYIIVADAKCPGDSVCRPISLVSQGCCHLGFAGRGCRDEGVRPRTDASPQETLRPPQVRAGDVRR